MMQKTIVINLYTKLYRKQEIELNKDGDIFINQLFFDTNSYQECYNNQLAEIEEGLTRLWNIEIALTSVILNDVNLHLSGCF